MWKLKLINTFVTKLYHKKEGLLCRYILQLQMINTRDLMYPVEIAIYFYLGIICALRLHYYN